MSLLDTASLVVTPNAYKEGKLYSVIPSDGSGDLSVTRATTATRVNSAGLVELVPYNLLSYSERFENAAWLKDGTVTPNTTIAPNGTLTADTWTTVLINNVIYQIVSVSPSTEYTFSFYVKRGTLTDLSYSIYNITGASNIVTQNYYAQTSSTEWVRITHTFTTPVGCTQIRVHPKVSSGGIAVGTVFFWGAQLNEGTLKDYFATETRLNISRIDYSLGGCPSILVEPQRTNLALWSEQFDNAAWAKNAATITANSVNSPSGIQNADTLTANGLLNYHSVNNLTSIPVTAIQYTASIYAKKGTNDFIQILSSGVTGGHYANFNLANGVVGSVGKISGVDPTSTITDEGDGWYRCTMTFTAIAGNFNLYAAVAASATDTRAQTNTLTTSIYLWGAQLEAGAYPTSYIPTTSASVTRNADVLDRSNIYTNNWITASGGTWFVELKNNVPLTRENTNKFGIGNTTDLGTNSLFLLGGSAQRMVIQKRIAGVNSTLYVTTADTCKIAIKWNGATADVFENGVKVVNATAFTPTDMEYLRSNALGVKAYINVMALWPTPISDAELIEYTTI